MPTRGKRPFAQREVCPATFFVHHYEQNACSHRALRRDEEVTLHTARYDIASRAAKRRFSSYQSFLATGQTGRCIIICRSQLFLSKATALQVLMISQEIIMCNAGHARLSLESDKRGVLRDRFISSSLRPCHSRHHRSFFLLCGWYSGRRARGQATRVASHSPRGEGQAA